MNEPILKDDPNLKLPASVRAQAARAEEIHRAMSAQGEVTPEGNADTDAAALAADNTQVGQLTDQTATQEPTASQQVAAPPEDDQSWEHKYKSIHGRYTRAMEQNRSLTEAVQNLQNIIATMQATQPAPAATVPDMAPEKLITAEEAADYGDDFLKVVGKKAREELAPVINAYKAEIENLKNQLKGFSGFVQQDSHTKLMATLDKDLPNWRELNTNQEFLDWLSLPDPYSGAIRHDMLKAAYAQGNASRVLAFFNGFLAEEAAVAPVRAEPDPAVTTVAKVPLATLAAPGRAKTAASTPAPAEKPITTRAQIAAFYTDVNAGKYRGRDAEKTQAENMIFAAQREGRIR